MEELPNRYCFGIYSAISLWVMVYPNMATFSASNTCSYIHLEFNNFILLSKRLLTLKMFGFFLSENFRFRENHFPMFYLKVTVSVSQRIITRFNFSCHKNLYLGVISLKVTVAVSGNMILNYIGNLFGNKDTSFFCICLLTMLIMSQQFGFE